MAGMTETVFVSEGMARYVGGTITESTGKDISTATFLVSLGDSGNIPPSAGWVAPDVNVEGTSTAVRVVKMLIDSGDPGAYFLWVKVTDIPEIEPLNICRVTIG